MKLDRIIVHDFLTYEFEDYHFENRPLQVQGRNLTEDDQESNGSGKSGLLTGVEFCIASSNSRDVRDNELVMFGKDFARVQLYASCEIRKQQIHIAWKINVKGSNTLVLKTRMFGEEAWVKSSFSNVNDGKKFISNWFAIEKEDLFNYFIINNKRFESFFKSSNTSKTNLINRFSDASIVDGLDKVDLEKEQSELQKTKDNIQRSQGRIEQLLLSKQKELDRDLKQEVLMKKKLIIDQLTELKDQDAKTQDKIQLLENERDIDLIKESKSIEKKIAEKTALRILAKDHVSIEIEKLNPIKEQLKKSQKLLSDYIDTDWDKERESFNQEKLTKAQKLKQAKQILNDQIIAKNELQVSLNEIDVQLKGVLVCPSCSFEFIPDSDPVEELKLRKTELSRDIEKRSENKVKVDKVISTIRDMIEKIESNISEINDKERLENIDKNKLSASVNQIESTLNTYKRNVTAAENKVDDINFSISNLQRDYKYIETKKADINSKIENHKNTIENNKAKKQNLIDSSNNIKKDNIEERLLELDEEIEEIKQEIIALEKQKDDQQNSITLQAQWGNNFKQFRMHLANLSLDVIEFHCNRYLEQMNSDLQVKFEGYKVLADGKIKDEITTKIIRGQRERTYASFSGGERGRLLFASILANRHMINSTHPYGGLDFLSIDEVFEGIDSLGVNSLIKSAKQLNISVMIITHVLSDTLDSDTLLIEKVKGISKIKR